MHYRTLGKTGIEVSEVGFGSHLSKANQADPAERRRQIQAGLDLGINLFDIYEHSYAQYAPMDEALAPVRDEVLISLVTVWRSAGEVMEEVEYALHSFHRETIDLYRLVLAGNWEDSEQRVETLLRAKEQGKIRALGAVVHYPEHLLEGLRRFSGLIDFVMVPASFCAPLLIRPDREIARAIAREKAGVIAIKAMAAADADGGYIFKLAPTDPELERLRARGLNLATLAIKFLLQADNVHTVLPTMNSIREVEEDVEAADGIPLSPDERRFIEIYRREAEQMFPQMLRADNYWVNPWRD